jgi:outer membrane murein-binding lipoprotein Lpp
MKVIILCVIMSTLLVSCSSTVKKKNQLPSKVTTEARDRN